MEINFQKTSELEGQLTIKISEQDYKSTYNQKLKDYGKKVNLKGYRPGKVPTSVVERMAGPSILSEEIFGAVDKEINNYIKENDLNLVGKPLPAESEKNKEINWTAQKDFEFIYDIATVPAFEVNISKKLSFNEYTIKADAEKIQEVHESMLKRYGTSQPMEVVEAGNVVKGDVKAIDGEYENAINLWLEKLKPAQAKTFIGKKVDDVVSFDIQKLFSKDAMLIGQFLGISKEDAEKTSGEYEMKITNITQYVDAEINQAYYDKLFGEGKITSEEEYNAEISKNVTSGYAPNVEYMLFKDMRTKLLEKTDVEFSKPFLKRWILEANKEAVLKDVEKDLDKYADEFKWSLIRNQIVSDNKIEVTYEAVKQDAFNKIVSQYLGGQQVTEEMKETFNGFVDKYLQEENGKNYYNHYENVLAGKVIDYLKENVSLKQKEVTTKEFEKLVEKSL